VIAVEQCADTPQAPEPAGASPTREQLLAWLPLRYKDRGLGALIVWYRLVSPERPTLRTLGERFGMSGENVRRIEAKTLRVLRDPAIRRQWEGMHPPVFAPSSRFALGLYGDAVEVRHHLGESE
jgi:hypothetical protein